MPNSADPKELTDIMADTAEGFEAVLRRAFEAGRIHGRRQAARAFRERLMRVVDPDLEEEGLAPDAQSSGAPTAVEQPSGARAVPGSVKPAVERTVRDNPGLTTEQIQARTGFKINSVRGTLWALSAQDKTIEKREGRWFPIAEPPMEEMRKRIETILN
jgi:hypothetical protein